MLDKLNNVLGGLKWLGEESQKKIDLAEKVTKIEKNVLDLKMDEEELKKLKGNKYVAKYGIEFIERYTAANIMITQYMADLVKLGLKEGDTLDSEKYAKLMEINKPLIDHYKEIKAWKSKE